MQPPMPNLMGDAKAVAPQHRWVVFRIEVLIDQHKFLLNKDRAENVRLAAYHRPVQSLVQIIKTKPEREMMGGDVIDRHRQLDRLADCVLVFGQQQFRVLLNLIFS